MGFDSTANNIVFAFRGSSNIGNWVANIKTAKTTYGHCRDCKVHIGFYGVWKVLRNDVLSGARNLVAKYPNANVVVTGHSLGGTTATLAALAI